jgi:YbbR domain-containing protein
MAYHPFRHLGLKVLALALAAVLWLSVAGEHVVERTVRVPLEFRNPPAALEIVGDPPTSVDVRLRGPSAVLSRLDAGAVVAVLDLSGARPGARLFHLRNDEVRAPYGVEVAQVMPGTVPLEFEKSARRTLAIVPAVEGDPAPGFVVGGVSSDPATVEVVGPQSRLRQLANATTEPVSVAGGRERIRDQVTVGVSDSSVRLVQPVAATVVVDILPAPVEREFAGVAIRWRNLGPGLRAQLEPTLTRVTVRGRKEAVADLRAGGLDAFVDLAGLGPGRYNLRVQVDPAQNFGVSAISPPTVDVTIK